MGRTIHASIGRTGVQGLRVAPMPWVSVQFEQQEVSRIELTRSEYTIGRLLDSDIALPHITVSRRHARLLRIETGYAVEDVASACGVTVDGRGVFPGLPVELNEGESIRIGSAFFLVYHVG